MTHVWTDTAVLQRVDGSELFRLVEPLRYVSKRGDTYTMLPGFMCDGASIPRVVRSLVGDAIGGEYTEPAILHDAVIRSGLFSLARCDALMREAMHAHATRLETINSIMLGLRVGRLWRRRRPIDPAAERYLQITPGGDL